MPQIIVRPRRAAVLGAGFGGLLAAAALSGVVDEVVVIERDRLPDEAVARRGVPQSAQLHNLLHPAHRDAEALVPGFVAALLAAGATRASVASDTDVFEIGRWMPKRDLGLAILSVDRPTIDHVLRGFVCALPNVEIRDRRTVTGLDVLDGSVAGVLTSTAEGAEDRIDADLVVDALGATSPVDRFLGDRGMQVPVEQREVAQWYCTCAFERPAELHGSSRYLLILPSAMCSRGGLASPVGTSGLSVSVSGISADKPPSDHDEYLRYAASLEDPALYELLVRCRPLTKPSLFRKMRVIWRHYERAEHPIVGLLPIGDAFANLNPLQGQGMSVAAMQATALASTARASTERRALTTEYLRRAAEPIRKAWDLAAITGPAGEERLPWSYLSALADRFETDADLHNLYVRVWHLLEPVDRLTSPDVRNRIVG